MEDTKDDLDIFNTMLNGTYVPEDINSNEEEENEEVTQEEDTDQEEESETEDQPETSIDDETDEESAEEEEDEEEDTPVDTDSLEEEVEEEPEADVAEDPDTDDEDSTDTEEEADVVEAETTDTIDYKKFYEEVTGVEFTVNGKKTKGFTDPKKIIQSQQMAGGYANKMAGFKQYRPYMNPLKDRGMLDDPEKFNLAMSLIDGDKEALKHHIKTLGIDPVMDLDMEAIQYSGNNALASNTQLVLDDALEMANANGVGDKFSNVIAKEWDQSSFETLMDNGTARERLVTQMSDGTYDKVQDRISEIERTDVNGAFGAMDSIHKYHTALVQIEQEQKQQQATDIANRQAQAETSRKAEQDSKAAKIQAEKAKIAKARKDEEYKAKAAEQSKKVAAQRSKASAVSKKKSTKSKVKKEDPMLKSGKELEALLDTMIMGR